ncbi:SLAC1 anion channel family protein [Microbaculum marinisediminis]|uniref:SLAC1 anion channel family protein n=1 Tax=Microbaculum marinisediminis TaxID=2931392 RepID=A0AAW5R4N4_9HYPH|nr:SLAC1 anion channel family protein [Microbaculum sp. A6E488]MCT8974084.1 SLAC1 anion channel family protein [Microbaculum sp. A6E488]
MSEITAPTESRLAHFPVAFFAIVMGLSGVTLAYRASEHALGVDNGASQVVLIATICVFLVISAFYAAKAFTWTERVRAEWDNPLQIAFFPAISISVLLIATAMAPIWPETARPIWFVGMLAQGLLSLVVVANWIGHRTFQQMHLTPAWFIPAVGNIIVPVAGVGFGYPDISWLFFSAGLMFWIVLLTLVFNRLVFHDPLPGRLVPTLVILIAPPAVGFVSYLQLGGDLDPFALILLNVGYVFAGIVITQVPKFLTLSFALSWWALSFPIAALSIASLVYAERTGSQAHQTIGLVLVGILTVLVAGLAVRTIKAIGGNEICKPE